MIRQTPRGWLIDTNVVSELRRGRRCNPAVWTWAANVPQVACYLSRVTLAEIRFGIERAPGPDFRAELEGWLRDGLLPWFGDRILEVDENILIRWRRLMEEGRKRKYSFAQPDALLAATALETDLGVVTRDIGDFERAGLLLFNPWLEHAPAATPQ